MKCAFSTSIFCILKVEPSHVSLCHVEVKNEMYYFITSAALLIIEPPSSSGILILSYFELLILPKKGEQVFSKTTCAAITFMFHV